LSDRNSLLPPVYPITDRAIAGRPHSQQVAEMIAGGARLIQLREKSDVGHELFDDLRRAVGLAHEADGVRIVVNDRVDLALMLKASGVHLGQDDLPPAEARRLLGPAALIGFSTHSLEQARKALLEPVDYIAVGPIFGTSTKTDAHPVVGVELVKEVRSRVAGSVPVVAIGGITLENAASAWNAGASTVAVIGDICGRRPLSSRVREYGELFEKVKHS
jgi:thiamine-phosphate pyrophosphorylase